MAISRRDRSTRLLVIGLVVTSLVTVTLDFRGGSSGPLAAMGRTALTVVAPLQEVVSKAFRPVGSFFADIARLGSIKEENARLREQLAEVRRQQEQVVEIRTELERVRALLDLRDRLGFDTVGATVVGESFNNFEWTVTVDRGSVDGVEAKMPVMAPLGLAGEVVEVTGGSAKVRLLLDPRFAVGVRLASTGEKGLLVGQGGKDLRLDLIDPETPVEPGEQVLTSGIGGVFPAGIPVGEVSRVTPDEAGLKLDIQVRPFMDFSRLSEVLIVTSSKVLREPQQ